MKYFCISEQTSNYLQKYIVIRKRKIFTGLKTAQDLLEILKKHKNEKYLFPCSDIRKNDIPDFLKDGGYQLYRSDYLSHSRSKSFRFERSVLRYSCIL